MRRELVKNLHQRHVPKQRGQLYFMSPKDSGVLHRLDDPHTDLDFVEIERTDGPLQERVTALGPRGIELEEMSMAFNLVGFDVKDRAGQDNVAIVFRNAPGYKGVQELDVAFYRGKSNGSKISDTISHEIRGIYGTTN